MSLPLEGLKILDFTTLLPGPYATQILADMGADVLRVESPTRPDLINLMPPKVNKVTAAHATLNRNKQCIAVDLKQDQGKEIVRRLLKEYDIIIEQFRPGVMQRLGLDYDTLKEIQPNLIYCSLTGYGQTGPLRDRAGHDINYLALSGLASYSGRKDTGPVLSGTQIADIAGGSHHAVMAIQGAVIHRLSSGKGQYLDISISDAALALNTIFGASSLASGSSPKPGGELLNGGLYYDFYQTSDDRYISVGSLEPVFATKVLVALDLPHLMSKLANQSPSAQAEMRSKFAEIFRQQTQEYWINFFEPLDACVEPVLTVSEAFAHPHFIERGMVTVARDCEGNEIRQINSAMPFKRKEVHQTGKPQGADTETVLQRIQFSEEEIKKLKQEKCIR